MGSRMETVEREIHETNKKRVRAEVNQGNKKFTFSGHKFYKDLKRPPFQELHEAVMKLLGELGYPNTTLISNVNLTGGPGKRGPIEFEFVLIQDAATMFRKDRMQKLANLNTIIRRMDPDRPPVVMIDKAYP